MSVQIKLDKKESVKIRAIAEKAINKLKKLGKYNKHIANKKFTHQEVMLNGLGFEFAVAKYLGLKHSVMFTNHHDDGRDIYYNEMWFDCKLVQPDRPDILMQLFNSKMKADGYIFGTGIFPNYEIIGYFNREDIFQPKFIGEIWFNGKNVTRYIYPRKLAYPIENLRSRNSSSTF